MVRKFSKARLRLIIVVAQSKVNLKFSEVYKLSKVLLELNGGTVSEYLFKWLLAKALSFSANMS